MDHEDEFEKMMRETEALPTFKTNILGWAIAIASATIVVCAIVFFVHFAF